jgi:hypothetical protein
MDLAVVEDSDAAANGRQLPDLLPCPVPAAPGSRLSFSWGPGCQLHLAEVASPSTGAGGVQPYAGSCDWCVLRRRCIAPSQPAVCCCRLTYLIVCGVIYTGQA